MSDHVHLVEIERRLDQLRDSHQELVRLAIAQERAIAMLRLALVPLAKIALPDDFGELTADERVPDDEPCFYAPAVTCGAIRTARKLLLGGAD